MAEEGRVQRVSVYSYQKRYNPNKFYVYILQVEREGHREPSYLFRSYKEFSELHQKVILLYYCSFIYIMYSWYAGFVYVKVLVSFW